MSQHRGRRDRRASDPTQFFATGASGLRIEVLVFLQEGGGRREVQGFGVSFFTGGGGVIIVVEDSPS